MAWRSRKGRQQARPRLEAPPLVWAFTIGDSSRPWHAAKQANRRQSGNLRYWLASECHRLLTCSFNRAVDEAVAAAYAYFQPES
jgi:hypothetical protein